VLQGNRQGGRQNLGDGGEDGRRATRMLAEASQNTIISNDESSTCQWLYVHTAEQAVISATMPKNAVDHS
jgi:hypothetical protein